METEIVRFGGTVRFHMNFFFKAILSLSLSLSLVFGWDESNGRRDINGKIYGK